MQSLKLRGLIPLLVLVAIAAGVKLMPKLTTKAVDDFAFQEMPDSEYYQLVPGSVYDGDTLRVTDGSKEIKIRFCGIDAPEKEQAMGLEARDHLRNLIDQGDGRLVVLPVETDRYGRTVAEVFVPTSTAEIHLNSQMVADGYAYHYARYSGECPNGHLLAGVEAQARSRSAGVWASPNAVKPWDYRN